jgi:hypothetical protein
VENRFIRVTQQRDKTWSVLRGQRGIFLLGFAIKAHAVAYGRAVSLSSKLTLFVDNQYGTPVRQSAASLTYPRLLN